METADSNIYFLSVTLGGMKALIAVVAIFLTQAMAQTPPAAPKVFKDSVLGFQYVPPPGMYDLTQVDRQDIERRATAAGKTNTMNLLLSLRSGPDDRATDWRTIGIETYPRDKVHSSSDRDASKTFSGWVAGGASETGQPKDIAIGEFRFVVSTFERHEGQLTKYACVYTTVKDGKLLSLSFSTNSQDVLNKIVESLKSFRALPR